MDAVLNWIWQGCAVAAATAGVLHLLGRTRARHRFVLCWLGLLAVVLLPFVPHAWGALSTAAHPLAAPGAAGPVFAVQPAWWMSSTIAIGLWILWSAGYGLRMAHSLQAVRRMKGRSLPFPHTVESRLRCWNEVSASGRRTRLVVSPEVRSAAVLGSGTPVIAVAPALIRHLTDDELDRVVVHEWAHVQRRDDLLNLAQLTVRLLAGWHPAVWWLDRQLQIEREAACDETAVEVTGCPKAYAASLTSVAGLFPARVQSMAALGALSSPGFASRVARILVQARLVAPAWSTGAALAAVAPLFVLSIVVARVEIVGTVVMATQREAVEALVLPSVGQTAIPASVNAVDGRSGSRLQSPPVRATGRTQPPSRDTIRHRSQARFAPAAAPRVPTDATAGPIARAAQNDDAAVEEQRPPASVLMPIDAVPLAIAASGAHVPAVPAPQTSAAPPSPWTAAADSGAAVGRRSQQAAVATAGAFGRFGKKIAASF